MEVDKTESLHELLQRVSSRITRQASPGELSQMKRQAPDEPPCPAFYRLAMPEVENYRYYPSDEHSAIAFETGLMSVLAGMAEDLSVFNRSKPLGSALAEAGFSELRLYRLLKAGRESLNADVRRMVKFLSSKGVSANLAEALELILCQDDTERSRFVRRRISRDYFRNSEPKIA